MCGICGIVVSDPRNLNDSLLKSMNRTLVHRGPDDEGYYLNGRAALAMRRLSIIDLDGGKQPISNEDKTLWIVFNGEIYNFNEMRIRLLARGHKFRTFSDTEVILHAYEEYGKKCLTYLNGMFAFAIWDERKETLFLARDRLGIKPLVYSFTTIGDFFFASELKALFAAPIDKTIDRQAIYDYLSYMYIPTPSTAYANIKKLPPGHFLELSDGQICIERYWDLALPDADDVYTLGNDHEEQVLDLIQKAVRRQMIADVEVGALLSGGLDSTTVTAIMAKRLDAKVRTFTIGFKEKSYDESEEARLVANILGTNHIEKIVNPQLIDSIPDFLNFFDEPFADYSAIPTFLVSKIAAGYLKVVLTGDGGDEVFAGYPTHLAYRVTRIYKLLPDFVRLHMIKPLVEHLPTSMERISFDYKAKRFVNGAEMPMERGHYTWKVIFDEKAKQKLLSDDFGKGYDDSFHAMETHFDKCKRAHPLNRLLYVDMKTFLLDDNLTKVDRMTMANSLEARVPLLDHELVEYVALLPPKVKSSGLETKKLLRNSVKDLLPPEIRKGKKKGFTPPLPFWISNEMKPLFQDYFSDKRLNSFSVFNPDFCKKLLNDHLSGKVDNNRELWTLLALMCWMEKNRI